MTQKNLSLIGTASVLATFATTAQGAAPSTDSRYEDIRRIMREYVQKVVQDECSTLEGFDFNSYEWDNYQLAGLQIVLLDVVNHTMNYCKPPELAGIHSTKRNNGEDETSKVRK